MLVKRRKEKTRKRTWLEVERLETRITPVTRTWTGFGPTSSWVDPSNWAPIGSPQVDDDVIILNPSPGSLEDQPVITGLMGNVVIRSLSTNDTTAVISLQDNATLTVNGGTSNWAGLTLGASGGHLIVDGGEFNFNGLTFQVQTLTTRNNAVLNLNGGRIGKPLIGFEIPPANIVVEGGSRLNWRAGEMDIDSLTVRGEATFHIQANANTLKCPLINVGQSSFGQFLVGGSSVAERLNSNVDISNTDIFHVRNQGLLQFQDLQYGFVDTSDDLGIIQVWGDSPGIVGAVGGNIDGGPNGVLRVQAMATSTTYIPIQMAIYNYGFVAVTTNNAASIGRLGAVTPTEYPLTNYNHVQLDGSSLLPTTALQVHGNGVLNGSNGSMATFAANGGPVTINGGFLSLGGFVTAFGSPTGEYAVLQINGDITLDGNTLLSVYVDGLTNGRTSGIYASDDIVIEADARLRVTTLRGLPQATFSYRPVEAFDEIAGEFDTYIWGEAGANQVTYQNRTYTQQHLTLSNRFRPLTSTWIGYQSELPTHASWFNPNHWSDNIVPGWTGYQDANVVIPGLGTTTTTSPRIWFQDPLTFPDVRINTLNTGTVGGSDIQPILFVQGPLFIRGEGTSNWMGSISNQLPGQQAIVGFLAVAAGATFNFYDGSIVTSLLDVGTGGTFNVLREADVLDVNELHIGYDDPVSSGTVNFGSTLAVDALSANIDMGRTIISVKETGLLHFRQTINPETSGGIYSSATTPGRIIVEAGGRMTVSGGSRVNNDLLRIALNAEVEGDELTTGTIELLNGAAADIGRGAGTAQNSIIVFGYGELVLNNSILGLAGRQLFSFPNGVVSVNRGQSAVIVGNMIIGGILQLGSDSGPSLEGQLSTLTVEGNVIFQTGSTFRVHINPQVDEDCDRLNVTGGVSLPNSSTLQVVTYEGMFDPLYTYHIIVTGSALEGTFSNVSFNPGDDMYQLFYEVYSLVLVPIL